MTDDETVVTSFVGEGEDLLGTWTVTKVKHSKGHLPPLAGREVVAVTDERLLWFSDELEAVALDAIEEREREFIERQAAPPMVIGATLLVVLGVFGSIGAFFANVGGPLVIALPALTGILLFFVANVFANVTGREGELRSGHRVRLWTDDGPVSIWGEEEPLAALEAAIVDASGIEVADSGPGDPQSAPDESAADEDSASDGDDGSADVPDETPTSAERDGGGVDEDD